MLVKIVANAPLNVTIAQALRASILYKTLDIGLHRRYVLAFHTVFVYLGIPSSRNNSVKDNNKISVMCITMIDL